MLFIYNVTPKLELSVAKDPLRQLESEGPIRYDRFIYFHCIITRPFSSL